MGFRVSAFKVGPDYIDPQFLALASGGDCLNLDLWGMGESGVCDLVVGVGDVDFVLVEGVMGLFDGGRDGYGSSADIASLFGWGVVLVIDGRHQSESVAALIRGFREFRSDVSIVGVIFNRVSSESHRRWLCEIMLRHHSDLLVLGFIGESDVFGYESRHLGLCQACEAESRVDAQLQEAALVISENIDLRELAGLAMEHDVARENDTGSAVKASLLSRYRTAYGHIAIAYDEAFSFIYAHQLYWWRVSGVVLSFFSPLNDETPDASADCVFLPGGYPELHAERLAAARNFKDGMASLAGHVPIYGECGGYMVMGESICDAQGQSHSMLGFFPLICGFTPPQLHLGYRRARLLGECDLVALAGDFVNAHEFHHAKVLKCEYSDTTKPLWQVHDSMGQDLGQVGHCADNLSGSFIHVIA